MGKISERMDKIRNKGMNTDTYIPSDNLLLQAVTEAAMKILADQEKERGHKQTGRPKYDLDQAQFEKLCGLQCTQKEILAWFGITDKTLNRWCKDTYGKPFLQVYEDKKGKGKISLRRAQFRLAENNASMGIWLGKQYLDQHDERDLRFKEGSIGVQIIDNIPKSAEKKEETIEENTEQNKGKSGE